MGSGAVPGGHGRAHAIAFSLQMDASRCVARVRTCPRMLTLMYPPRTRGVLSVYITSNGVQRIIPTTDYVWGLAGRCMDCDLRRDRLVSRMNTESQTLKG